MQSFSNIGGNRAEKLSFKSGLGKTMHETEPAHSHPVKIIEVGQNQTHKSASFG